MNIVLINPPQVFSKYQVAAGVVPPLGLAYLASYLIKSGHTVTIIDSLGEGHNILREWKDDLYLRGLHFADIIKKIPRNTQVVGISNHFTIAFPSVLALAAEIKEKYNISLVLGGANATALYEAALQEECVDYVLFSEAETSFNSLCAYLAGKANIDDIDGIAYKSNGHIFYNQKTYYIPDPDKLPFPARDLLPQEQYQEAREAHGPAQKRWTTIISSRGCPFECTFCTSELWGRKWRGRSAKNVVDEIELCMNRYRITEFHFEDENMTMNAKRMNEICDEILKRELKINWQTPNGIRAETINGELLKKMKESGCCHVVFAPESGSPKVLNEIMNKKPDLEKIEELIIIANKIKLKTAAFFILGCPGETIDDIKKTMQYSKKLARKGLDEVVFSLFIPIPGTELFRQLTKNGYILLDYESLVTIGDIKKGVSLTRHISGKKLMQYRLKAYTGFHLTKAVFHPFKTLRSFFNIITGREEIKTERVFHTLFRRIFKRNKIKIKT
ncbi:MAG: B12-binding domain-containing radical SAM protein [bacterium]|nr:B12-binding domain-containing radical SAM protein [bacterium]